MLSPFHAGAPAPGNEYLPSRLSDGPRLVAPVRVLAHINPVVPARPEPRYDSTVTGCRHSRTGVARDAGSPYDEGGQIVS
jgi:hypothetical protein